MALLGGGGGAAARGSTAELRTLLAFNSSNIISMYFIEIELGVKFIDSVSLII